MALLVLIRRAVGAVWTYFCREWDSDDLWSSQVIGPALLNHLKLVYSLLICVSLSSAFGSYLCLTGTIESSVAILGAFVNTLCFYFVAPRNQNARLCLFIFGAIFGGAIVAPWMTRFLNVDTRFVVFSLSSSSVVLGSYLKVCKLMNHYTTWRKIWPSSFLLGFLPTMIWLPIVSFVIGGDVSRLKSQVRID
ncbi:hypothetical protein BUALT_Bualt01G0185300 [Buddleja alternifolia]|uniref:Uncharacterized protein n=1 Tax=Buddleja alternifolia TaxID=168488 RepID=A0AAV6Y871_9LAMI|nr:hypothetical protein BUALT_Bualt01G0185300 [Buddleja alternifolia]